MEELEEAKEIMKKAGCGKAFAVYDLELNEIAEVRDCNENGESLEISKDISDLSPTIEKKLVFIIMTIHILTGSRPITAGF